jgi:hypothetical protein
MFIEILEIARREYDEAKEFYEIEQPGVGTQFEKQIRHSLINNTLKRGCPSGKKFGGTSYTNSHIRFSIPFRITKQLFLHSRIYIDQPHYWIDRMN